jgi:hypothetical protein
VTWPDGVEHVFELCRLANVVLGFIAVTLLGARLGTAIWQKQPTTYLVYGALFIFYVAVVSYGAYRADAVGNIATEASVLIFALNIVLITVNVYQIVDFEVQNRTKATPADASVKRPRKRLK